MSEQSKSNLQVFGAGAAAFGAVVILGGAALMAYSSWRASAEPAPAAPPIDLSRSSEAPVPDRERVARESRAPSPAPLIGDEESADEPAAAAADDPVPAMSAAPAASAPQAAETAAAVKAALKQVQAIGASGAATSAEAKIASVEPQKKDESAAVPAVVPARSKLKAPRLELKGDAVAATVQYGVTDRSRLMGRAAGPVYNFKGAGGGASQAARMPGASGKATTAATAAAPATVAQDQVDAVKKSVDATALSAEEKRLIQAELDKVSQAVAPARTRAQ